MTVVDIAKSLISFDSSGPPTREKPVADWIHDFLEDLGVDSTIQVVGPDRANLVAKIGEGRGPGVVLSGHIDVVPSGDLKLWTESGPYEPVVAKEKLFGRGACDMKGPDACILQAFKELRGENFKKQLILAFTAGEDTGGWFVDKVLEDKLITPKDARFGIIPEPSVMQIVTAHKGAGGCKVVVRGKAAHSSRPELGVNAILNAADFLEEVKILQKEIDGVRHPLLGHSTIKPTLISGGFKSNIIPDKCEITINTRPISVHANDETLANWLTKIFDKVKARNPSFSAEIIDPRTSEALDVPNDSEVVLLAKEILHTEPIGVPYYTEAVSYAKSGIPTIICGPGDIEQAHTPNEFITLDQLDQGTEFFRQIIKKTCT